MCKSSAKAGGQAGRVSPAEGGQRWQPRMPDAYCDITELLGDAAERRPLDGAPGKSGARLERVMIGGEPHVLKRSSLANDWTMRAAGTLRGAPVELWERGILGRLPDCF